MEKILIATRNFGKATEFKAMFEPRGYVIETLHDYEDLPEIEENGQSFAENSQIKAETISEITDRIVIGDDSGLVVDALDGEPGIFSARYAGRDHDDEANNKKLLKNLSGLEGEDRRAYFHTSLTVATPGKESLTVEGRLDGYILEEERGNNGFGYDPLFYYPKEDKSLAEMSADEKNAISHRANALQALDKEWDQWIGKK